MVEIMSQGELTCIRRVSDSDMNGMGGYSENQGFFDRNPLVFLKSVGMHIDRCTSIIYQNEWSDHRSWVCTLITKFV